MSDYAQLQSDVADWLARDELTGVIPTFIVLCEARINRDVRIQPMMRRARALGQDTNFMPLPLLFLEMRRLSKVDENGCIEELQQVAPEAYRVRANGGAPQRYTLHRELEFDAPVPSTMALEMVYYRAVDPLSDTNTTNWFIENAYDLYLYGSLLGAEPYLRNDERLDVWSGGYDRALLTLNEQDKRGRRTSGGETFSLASAGFPTP